MKYLGGFSIITLVAFVYALVAILPIGLVDALAGKLTRRIFTDASSFELAARVCLTTLLFSFGWMSTTSGEVTGRAVMALLCLGYLGSHGVARRQKSPGLFHDTSPSDAVLQSVLGGVKNLLYLTACLALLFALVGFAHGAAIAWGLTAPLLIARLHLAVSSRETLTVREHFDKTAHFAALALIFSTVFALAPNLWDPNAGVAPILFLFPLAVGGATVASLVVNLTYGSLSPGRGHWFSIVTAVKKIAFTGCIFALCLLPLDFYLMIKDMMEND